MSRTMAAARRRDLTLAAIVRWATPSALLVLLVLFAAASPTFRTPGNLLHILVNNFTLPALVALGMTLVVSAGGIDLSVGTSADIAAMIAVTLMAAGHGLLLSLGAGLAGALAVGLVDALLISGLGISPFLATLGVLFVGESVQQLATNGGTPIYLVSNFPSAGLAGLAHGALLAVPAPLWILGAAVFLVEVLLRRTAFGRHVRASGAAPQVARYSGLPVRRTIGLVYILSALLCGIAGLLLAATVKSYVPLSGNAFLLDAIGAVFVGTTISREAKPNVLGTLLGVFLFGMLHNGLLLIGWNFYWQQVAVGLLVFGVLAASFSARRLQARD
ncbi:MAG TPA: ABC transporter permease [Acidisoma sp.]|jgi:ribose transport system permease protein|uniref:ABC transporter permease n=1 Tax=Acidisoma sp. TaxID=1872115 RepID=UPI002BD8FF42|nr:ABC transporter permease [Acidisoma sp.]HTI03480.1 ABC transporter permease [Acidisoma sp.]